MYINRLHCAGCFWCGLFIGAALIGPSICEFIYLFYGGAR